jgi:hypothetical protein
MTDQTLIYSGEAVKALGAGRVGGYLIRFGTPDDHDVQGDFFTPETYVGRAVKGGVDVIFDHGMFKRHPLAMKLGNQVLGEGTISRREDGWYVEATLDISRDDSIKAAYQEAEAGRLGWSSGSTDRMVRKTAVKAGVHRVDAWPLIEASLTPKPVDPRNRAFAIKSLNEDMDLPVAGLVDRAEALVADAEALKGLFGKAADQRRDEQRDLSPAKREAIKAIADAFESLYAASVPKVDPEQAKRLRRRLLAQRMRFTNVD